MKNTLLLILLVSLVYSQEKSDYSNKFDQFISSNAGTINSFEYYPIAHSLKGGGLGFKAAFDIQIIKAKIGSAEDIFIHFYYSDEYSWHEAYIDYKDFSDITKAMNELIKDYNRDKTTTDAMRQGNYKIKNEFVSSDNKFRVGYGNRLPKNKYDLKWNMRIDRHSVEIDLVKLGTLLNTIAFKIDDLTDGR